MLERCPYYERCDANTRQFRGNREYYCLGSLNWEFCPQFKEIILSGDSPHGMGRDVAITKVARTIYRGLHNALESPLKVLLLSANGEILYRDRQWKETYLLVAQNLVRYMSDTLKDGEYFTLQTMENFIFMKILHPIMLVCMIQIDLETLLTILKDHIPQYQQLCNTYLSEHPPSDEEKVVIKSDESLVLQMFSNLQQKLEAINPEIVIGELNKIQGKILDIFSWNQIFYEIAALIKELEQVPAQNELNHQEKEEILGKIREWQDKIRQFS